MSMRQKCSRICMFTQALRVDFDFASMDGKLPWVHPQVQTQDLANTVKALLEQLDSPRQCSIVFNLIMSFR